MLPGLSRNSTSGVDKLSASEWPAVFAQLRRWRYGSSLLLTNTG
jgi:hypothetical protein